MSPLLILTISFLYVALLFLIAWWADRREKAGKSLVNNSAIYALSLAVYCTAWTFYGSVGRAATMTVVYTIVALILVDCVFTVLFFLYEA